MKRDKGWTTSADTIGVIIASMVFIVLTLRIGFVHWLNFDLIDRKIYGIVTGTLVAMALVWQWRLYLRRSLRATQSYVAEVSLHKWIGSVTLLLLVVHAGSFGVNLSFVMSSLILVIVYTGLVHLLTNRLGYASFRHIWEWTHIGLAAALIPLVGIHIWTALVFHAPR